MSDTTNTDAFNADVDGVESETSASKEAAKTLVIIAATTAVMLGAPKVARLATAKIVDYRVSRQMRKDLAKVHVVTDLPDTEKSA